MRPHGGFGVQPQAMRNAISGIESVIGGIGSTASALSSVVLAATAFAQIGQTTAAQNASLTSTQSSAVSSWNQILQRISQLLSSVVQGYEQTDSAVAQSFGGDQNGTQTGATTAAAPPRRARRPHGPAPRRTPASNDPILAAAGTHHYGDSGRTSPPCSSNSTRPATTWVPRMANGACTPLRRWPSTPTTTI